MNVWQKWRTNIEHEILNNEKRAYNAKMLDYHQTYNTELKQFCYTHIRTNKHYIYNVLQCVFPE